MDKTHRLFPIILMIIICSIPKPGKCLSGDLSTHDPSTIIKDGSKYWYFSSGEGINANVSTDLYGWKASEKTVFSKGTWPSWINNYVPEFAGYFWAPDIIFFNGNYYLYYSCSTLSSQISAIGVAMSPTLDPNAAGYGWKDLGMVTSSETLQHINAIDPSVFKDTDGRLYLTYGSFSDGIGVIELDTLTGKLKSGARLNRVAGGNHAAWEAPCLIKEGAYYYLFVNRALCCIGSSSTYYLVAGRSKSPTGPFSDKNGIDLRGNNNITSGTPVLVSSGRYKGPGHLGLLRDNGRNIISMHYYDQLDNGYPKLDIARLQFTDDGWPVINRNYIEGGRYKITNAESGGVWEGPGCYVTDPQKIVINSDNNTSCQSWDFSPMGDGYYKISNAEKKDALSVPSCNSTNGTNVLGWTWLNNDCQKFKIEQLANGRYVFTALANHTISKVLQVSSETASGLGTLNLTDYSGSVGQQWNMIQQDAPTVHGATNITDSSFTANWKSLASASYRLDVFTASTDAAVQTVAAWDFESGTNKANSDIPDNLGKTINIIGTGKALYSAAGNGGNTAVATGWEFNGKEKYWEANFSTLHFYNLKVSSKQRSGNAGPRHFKLQYKIGEAGTYTDVLTGLVSNLNNFSAGELKNVVLPEACENQTAIYLRWLLITPVNLKDLGIDPSAQSNIDDIIITGSQGDFLPGYRNLLVEDSAKLIRGLAPGTDFFYRVRAENGSFTSANSRIVKVTTAGISSLSFKSVTAAKKEKPIQVGWEVSGDRDIAKYDVERSADGKLFNRIGSVANTAPPGPFHTYNYTDAIPLLNDNFYRIKAITSSGIVKYSPIAHVYIEKGKNGIFFYPTPSDGKTIMVHLSNEGMGENHIQLFDSKGSEVYRTRINHAGGSLKLRLFLGNLLTGIYHFRVSNSNYKMGQTIIVLAK